MILTLSIIATLLIIAVEDFSSRRIHWLTLPVLLALLAADTVQQFGWGSLARHFTFNLAFFALQYLLATAWFSVKRGRLVNLADIYIGWGDILFIIVLCAAFAPAGFILFYLAGLTATLLVFLLLKLLYGKPGRHIPLAGCLASLLIVFLLANVFAPALLTDLRLLPSPELPTSNLQLSTCNFQLQSFNFQL